MQKVIRSLVASLVTFALLAAMPATGAETGAEAGGGGYACRTDIFPALEGVSPGGGHVAGVVEASNGDLLYTFNSTWYEGPHATTKWGTGPVTRVYLARLPAGSDTWEPPKRIDYPRPFQIHNAVLWDDGAGKLYMFFTVLEGMDHTESTLELMVSTDRGNTWSEPRTLRQEWGWMFGTRPFRMSNGEVVVPVYREVSPNGAGFLISSDGFETYQVHPAQEELWPGVPLAIMASTVELEPGHLLAYLRANGGHILQSHSLDYGRTWTPAVPTPIESPWARVALLKLDNGNLVLAHNPHTSDRAPLRLTLSEDGGQTWGEGVLVETDPANRFDYPYLFQSSDGFIHLGYTHNNKKNMRHVVFDEEFVRSGQDLATDTAYQKYEHVDGAAAPVATCRYVNGAGASGAGDGAYACRQDLYRRQPNTYPYSAHVAGIIETAEGDLLYHFDGNTNIPDLVNRPEWTIARMALSRMPEGEDEWTFPQMVENEADPDSAHNTVLFDDGKGRIHNFFTTREGRSHSESALDYRYSDDGGHSWSRAVRIREEHGWMFGNRPFRMSNGEAIVPVYRESAPGGVGFFVSDNNFALGADGKPTYEVYPSDNDLLWPGSNAIGLQGATVELEPGHLVSFLRTNARFIYRTDSYDFGRTWTPAVPTQFPNPWSRVDLLKTAEGNLILAYNPSSSDRTPLVLALSEDGGLTWPHEVTIENDPTKSYSYPYLIQSSDGAIHLGYSHSPAGNMRHVVFNEEFLKTGATIPSDPEPTVYEYRDGALTTTDECGYVNGEGLPGEKAAYACRQDVHPQDPEFPGVHVATLEQAPNGDLLYGFYAGEREKADDVKTYMARLPVGENDWVAPRVIFDEPDKPDGNAVLWVDDDNDRVHLMFSTIQADGWTEADLRIITSTDDGETWSEPRYVREEWGWLFGTLPFRMSNGELIVPIYSEVEWSSGWYISGDDAQTFTPYPGNDDTAWPRSLAGMIQPATVELEPGHLIALNRSRDFHIWKTESFDFGRTWSPAVPTTLPNNNSRIALLKTSSGALILAHNPTRSGRTPLRLSLSLDGGATWPYEVDVEDAPDVEFSYPYLLETTDGMIHLGYTHRRESMRHLVFNEAFVKTGANIPSDGDFEKVYEYQGDALSVTEACGYAPL